MEIKNPTSNRLNDFINHYFKNRPPEIRPMPGDAGLRNYFRLVDDDYSRVLMDCPPSYCSVTPFIKMSRYLKSNGFSSPEIFAEDIPNGFLLLEDFGDLSLKKHLESLNNPKKVQQIYFLVIDFLICLQANKPPDNLIFFSNDILLAELDTFTSCYIPYKKGIELNGRELTRFKTIWAKILSNLEEMPSCPVLRDYHSENIMYLEEREGIKKLGLLDFQDALLGSPVYDLVSVLQDARIPVTRELELECIKYFASQKKLSLDRVLLNYNILGAQRNSRILGIFTRKFTRDKNDKYLRHIPLVVKYLEYNLLHPALAELKAWMGNILEK